MFLATGVGHSGTGWFARFMTEVGFPCTHEKQYNPKRNGPLTSSDSSWLAVPHLQSLPEGTPVVHLVRDPLQVLNSFIRTDGMKYKVNEGDLFADYAYKHLPPTKKPALQEDRLMIHITQWDLPVSQYQGPVMVFRVGEFRDPVADNRNPFALAGMVQFCTGETVCARNLNEKAKKLGRVNDHQRHKTNKHTWDSLPEGELKDRMKERAEQYGFLRT